MSVGRSIDPVVHEMNVPRRASAASMRSRIPSAFVRDVGSFLVLDMWFDRSIDCLGI